nr:glycerol dehydratase reactivase beta/small subunit family protein [Kineosporia mesophila]
MVFTAGTGHLLREICAGMEEEGVPYDVVASPGHPAEQLAHEAARRSPLEVGVGLDATGVIVVHHSKLPRGKPVSRTEAPTPTTARHAGQDAARVVTGAPLTRHPEKENP